MDELKKIPNQEEVKAIFNETYNLFYRKYKDMVDPEQWVPLMLDLKAISDKYPYPLCRSILAELSVCLEDEFKRRQAK